MNLGQGIQDAIQNMVDMDLLHRDVAYRQGVLEGLFRWRAFMNNDLSPLSSPKAIKAAVRTERGAIRQEIQKMERREEEAEELYSFRRQTRRNCSVSDEDANILPHGAGWRYPQFMPFSLSERLTSNPRTISRLARL